MQPTKPARAFPFSIELSPFYRGILKRQVDTGRYASSAEVIRAALRLLEQNYPTTPESTKAAES